jgi:hypothetical protein
MKGNDRLLTALRFLPVLSAFKPNWTNCSCCGGGDKNRGDQEATADRIREGIARLELGRVYWDEKLHREAAKKAEWPRSSGTQISARKTER